MGGSAVTLAVVGHYPVAPKPPDVLLYLRRQLELQRGLVQKMDRYYMGQQPLSFLHPDLERRLQRRITPLVVNWPRVIVDSIVERLTVQGFKSNGETDDRLWSWWQANDLDEWSQMGHTDAMVHGRAFVSVWGDDMRPEVPKICVESAYQMTVMYTPGTRDISAALKSWDDRDQLTGAVRTTYFVLYLPNEVQWWESPPDGSYSPVGNTLPNPLGVVPVVPLINRARLTSPLGESELADVVPIADGINKLATDMMVSSEFHAMPRRWVTGMEIPRDGASQTKLTDDVKKKWADAFPGQPWMGGKDVTFGQFTEASLENFIAGIKELTATLAGIAHLPPHYLGINSDNPASADAIRSADASAARTAEGKGKRGSFNGTWRRVARLATDVVDGPGAGAALQSLEVDWANAWIPTPAQAADAAVKLTQGIRPIISIQQAQRDLDYSPQEIKTMAGEIEAAPPVEQSPAIVSPETPV